MIKAKQILLFSGIGLIGLAILIPFVITAAVTVVNPIGYTDFGSLLLAIANGIAVLIGSLAVIMIIWSGILFLLSGGDPSRVKKAKDALLWAVVGIVIAILASAIIATIKGIIGA
jgi:uncharacterized BrkB/YihY/UPF0761 family membrane protein